MGERARGRLRLGSGHFVSIGGARVLPHLLLDRLQVLFPCMYVCMYVCMNISVLNICTVCMYFNVICMYACMNFFVLITVFFVYIKLIMYVCMYVNE